MQMVPSLHNVKYFFTAEEQNELSQLTQRLQEAECPMNPTKPSVVGNALPPVLALRPSQRGDLPGGLCW